MKRKVLIITTLTILILPILTQTTNANTYFYELEGKQTNNISTQNYSIYTETTKSYLYENIDKTISRVEYIPHENKILIETYNNLYKLKSTKKLNCSLPIFGGFYSGMKYNFIVLGQLNLTENNTIPIFRIEKYSKDWKKLGVAELNNCNTIIPFDAGNCRMAEEDGILYIETCHGMYKSSDGCNHQANLGIEINIENMQIIYSRTNIEYIGTGYVTHSFNQFIQVENGYTYTVNHGDAYPRSIVLIKRGKQAIWAKSYANVLKIPGEIGDNNTGTSIGGFEISSNNCLIAGNSILKNTKILNRKYNRNIFLSIIPKEEMKEEKTNTIWLTNYTDKDRINTSTPHLVKINERCFAVMWEEYEENSTRVKIAIVDENGNKTKEVITLEAQLSDCKPIVNNNKLTWYVSINNKKVIMYAVDLNSDYIYEKDIIENNNLLIGDTNGDGKVDTKDARIILLFYVGKEQINLKNRNILDVNKDGKIDTKDAREILLYYVGKNKSFGD